MRSRCDRVTSGSQTTGGRRLVRNADREKEEKEWWWWSWWSLITGVKFGIVGIVAVVFVFVLVVAVVLSRGMVTAESCNSVVVVVILWIGCSTWSIITVVTVAATAVRDRVPIGSGRIDDDDDDNDNNNDNDDDDLAFGFSVERCSGPLDRFVVRLCCNGGLGRARNDESLGSDATATAAMLSL